MIKTIPDLRVLATDVIKVAQVTDPTKTQGSRLLSLVNDILDTVDDLVLQQGLSISASTDTKISNAQPNLSPYQLISTAFNGNYNNLSNKPDLTAFRLNATAISYSDLTNKPILFSGSYLDLLNKPTIFDGNYNSLSNRPTLFNGDYTTLTNKPVIPTSITKLLWNQSSSVTVTNTTVETNTLVTGNGTLNIDINPIVGTSFRLTGRGLFSLQTITSPTLTVKLYLGTTLIASGVSSSLLLGASNKSFSFGTDILITSSTSVYAQGFFAYYAGATDVLSSTPLINSSAGALNTTIDLSVLNQLKMTFTWSVASAANIIMVKIANLEKLNN